MDWPGERYRLLCAIDGDHGYSKHGNIAARSTRQSLYEIFDFIRVPPTIEPFDDCDTVLSSREDGSEENGKKRKLSTREIAYKLKKVRKIMDEISSIPTRITGFDSSSSDEEDDDPDLDEFMGHDILKEWTSVNTQFDPFEPNNRSDPIEKRLEEKSIDGDSGFVDDASSSRSETMSHLDFSLPSPVVKMSMPSLTDLCKNPPPKPRESLTTIEVAADSDEGEPSNELPRRQPKHLAVKVRPILTAVTTQRIALFGHLKSNPTISEEERAKLKEVAAADSKVSELSSAYWCYKTKNSKYRTNWTKFDECTDLNGSFIQTIKPSDLNAMACSEIDVLPRPRKGKQKHKVSEAKSVEPKTDKFMSSMTLMQIMMRQRKGLKGLSIKSLSPRKII